MNKRMVSFLMLLALCGLLYGTERVLTWDDSQPFPFGGNMNTDGSTPMTGPLNMGAQTITNASSLQVTGGAVSGGVLVSDASGNLAYQGPVEFSAYNLSALVYTTGVYQAVNFTNEIFDLGSNYDASSATFTAPVSGIYEFNSTIYLLKPSTGARLQLYLYTNGAAGLQRAEVGNGDSRSISGTWTENMTNGKTAKIVLHYNSGGDESTNSPGALLNRFSGSLKAKQ